MDNYDVLVVGSGIAGAIIAKTLTGAHKRVLMLDAGLESGIATEQKPAFEAYMSYIQRYYTSIAKAPNAPYPNLPQAPSIDVLDLSGFVNGKNLTTGYLVQQGPDPFTSDNVRAAGGTTLHWLGTTLRMLPNDFRMHTEYGHGVDWPFTYDQLKPYYEMAENEIGVSGNVSEQEEKIPGAGPGYFGNDYTLPMKQIPTSYLDSLVAKAFEKAGVKCVSTPQGRNSVPNKDYPYARGIHWNPVLQKLELSPRAGSYEVVGSLWSPYVGERCEGNASCVPICPVQAKYDALKTLKDARANYDHDGNSLLTTISQAVATTVIKNPTTGEIIGVKYKQYKVGDPSGVYTEHVAKARIYVLAASAIENAKILLASGAANSSNQVGRNLMDHLCLLTWGLFPDPVYPFRGPGSTTNICSFRDGTFRKQHTAWICPLDNWGWGWPVFSPGSDVENFVLKQNFFGKKLRDELKAHVSRQVLLHFECEQDPHPENRVLIDDKYRDVLGNYRPVIKYHVSEYVLRAFEAAKQLSDTLFDKSNIKPFTKYKKGEPGFVEYNGQSYTYRGAGHIVGTHRSGPTKKDSVVNENMRTWDHPNLYLAGCGNMPTLGTSNPTLTMAATTFKAAEAILKQLC